MELISSVLTIMFANAGVTEQIDLMRCNLLGMKIASLVVQSNINTIDPIKETAEYRSVSYDVGCPDEFLQKLLDKAIELK